MNTKAAGVEMAEYGHAKDDSSVPQVDLSYAVKHEDATPCFTRCIREVLSITASVRIWQTGQRNMVINIWD